ncbi:hypothetical protein AVEN_196563-1, partial [Araneus ventricosus]
MKSDPAGVVRKFGVGVIQNQAKSVVRYVINSAKILSHIAK